MYAMACSGACIDVLDGVVLVTIVSRDNEGTDPVLGKSTCSAFGADRCMEHHKGANLEFDIFPFRI